MKVTAAKAMATEGGGGEIRTRVSLRLHPFQGCGMGHYPTPPGLNISKIFFQPKNFFYYTLHFQKMLLVGVSYF